MAEQTPHQQLADTEKQIADLTAKAEALKKQTREADLETVKKLVKLHGFSATDLRSELKTRATTKTTTTTRRAAAKNKKK